MIESFVEIQLAGTSKSGKTEIYEVKNVETGEKLGMIRWYARWHAYCYFQENDIVMSPSCLLNVSQYLNGLMDERKKK